MKSRDAQEADLGSPTWAALPTSSAIVLQHQAGTQSFVASPMRRATRVITSSPRKVPKVGAVLRKAYIYILQSSASLTPIDTSILVQYASPFLGHSASETRRRVRWT